MNRGVIDDHVARYVLGLLGPSEMVQFANDLLANGMETPELLMLSLPSEATPETFEKAMSELGISLPDKDTAILLMMRRLAAEVVAGDADPLTALSKFTDLRNEFCEVRGGAFVCPDQRLNDLADLFWAIDECWDIPSFPELQKASAIRREEIRQTTIAVCRSICHAA